jgi:hypothetical protein
MTNVSCCRVFNTKYGSNIVVLKQKLKAFDNDKDIDV